MNSKHTASPANPTDQISDLDKAVSDARTSLLADQKPDGHWCYELEADSSVSAEYILMMHFLNEIDKALQQKLAQHLRLQQNNEGGWALYFGGPAEISCSVKCYYALKLAGDSETAPHMQQAKVRILALGGAARSNALTRITLAFFKQVPWRAAPWMPIEIMFLPKWFFIHLSKVAYWSRTMMVPLLMLISIKAEAANPNGIEIQELFLIPAEQDSNYFSARSLINRFFIGINHIGRHLDFLVPKFVRKNAMKKAYTWLKLRLNDQHGLGAVFPAMVYTYEILNKINDQENQNHIENARLALKSHITKKKGSASLQPYLSPTWDTVLAILTLKASENAPESNIQYACDWLKAKQIKDQPGDWRQGNKNLQGGGWALQYQNNYYPSLDNTSLIAFCLLECNQSGYHTESITRAIHWIIRMQSDNGGFGSYDVHNNGTLLNEIPFADQGGLTELPTADVTARCVMLIGQVKNPTHHLSLIRAINFLFTIQEADGSWFGHRRTNCIYGTWSVLTALFKVGFSSNHPKIQKALYWLRSRQNSDGGWGEDNSSYVSKPTVYKSFPSTAFQTSWALLALMEAQEHDSEAVKKGILYLINTQHDNGFWDEPYFTAPGFSNDLYLKHHGYSKYFPLWALSQYQRILKQ